MVFLFHPSPVKYESILRIQLLKMEYEDLDMYLECLQYKSEEN